MTPEQHLELVRAELRAIADELFHKNGGRKQAERHAYGRRLNAAAALRTHPVDAAADRAAASPVLGDVAGARARAVRAGAEYRAAVVAAVDELERAGARDAFSRVAEAAGVSRQTVRTLVGRARADR